MFITQTNEKGMMEAGKHTDDVSARNLAGIYYRLENAKKRAGFPGDGKDRLVPVSKSGKFWKRAGVAALVLILFYWIFFIAIGFGPNQ